MSSWLSSVKGKLIVSCQALENEPLYGSDVMAKMAVAAVQGGAVAIRANTPQDIAAIKKQVNVPVIGLYKKDYSDSEIYITPTIHEVREIAEAGADMIAFDATLRLRPNGHTLESFVNEIKAEFPDLLLMADISTLEEGIFAEQIGIDVISTTLSGYTPYSPPVEGYNFELLEALLQKVSIPVISEGRVKTPSEAAACIEKGAYSVVVGSAITRPQLITKDFAELVEQAFKKYGGISCERNRYRYRWNKS